MKRKYIIPVFVPHRGCPNDCVFCNQKKITGQDNSVNGQQVEKIITEYLATIPVQGAREIEVAFYGGSFTGIDLEEQKELLLPAKQALETGHIQGIRLSTRPDYINEEILYNLQAYRVTTIELGVQSLEEEVLQQSQRGHTVKDVYHAVEMIKARNFQLGLQLMVGLPGDNEQTFIATVEKVIALRPDFIRIYPTLVIKETILAQMYQAGIYQPLTLEEAVARCQKAYQRFLEESIPVIRLGLQTTEEISQAGEVVAGPYHPAFRELVESALMREKLEVQLSNLSDFSGEPIVFAHSSKVSIVIGQKKENIRYLQHKYGWPRIKIIADDSLAKDEINIKFRKK